MARWLTGKKMLPAALAVVVLAGVLVWVLVLRGPGVVQDEKYLIGAYYYQWFPHNFTRGYLREKLVPPQPPQLGRYSSRDPKAVERHIAWATRHGIDFLALDWWPGVDKVNSVISESFLKARNIGDIKFCLFYESYGAGFRAEYGSTIFSDEMTENFVADVVKMAGLFFDHPSYLRVDGRPVVFFYVNPDILRQLRPGPGADQGRTGQKGDRPLPYRGRDLLEGHRHQAQPGRGQGGGGQGDSGLQPAPPEGADQAFRRHHLLQHVRVRVP